MYVGVGQKVHEVLKEAHRPLEQIHCSLGYNQYGFIETVWFFQYCTHALFSRFLNLQKIFDKIAQNLRTVSYKAVSYKTIKSNMKMYLTLDVILLLVSRKKLTLAK